MSEYIIVEVSIVTVILLLTLFAYKLGFLTLTSHASLLYVGSIWRARFSKCNGTFKKVIKLDEAKPYTFELKAKLTQGAVSAEILDRNKNVILSLDEQTATGKLFTKEKACYLLVVKIKKASGNYELIKK